MKPVLVCQAGKQDHKFKKITNKNFSQDSKELTEKEQI